MKPEFYGIIIAGGFVLIALVVFLIRKYVPGIKEDEPKEKPDEKKQAEDNVKNRLQEFVPEDEEDKDEE
jgi:large-conductance mechanosensitive channel